MDVAEHLVTGQDLRVVSYNFLGTFTLCEISFSCYIIFFKILTFVVLFPACELSCFSYFVLYAIIPVFHSVTVNGSEAVEKFFSLDKEMCNSQIF